MARSDLPPLNALKAFDAVARFGSMNRAAEALGIAPSSVTLHIRNLEDFIGAELFDRQTNAIRLNARGKSYAEEIRSAFDTIQSATGSILEEVAEDPIRVSCVPTLAGPWLAQQLAIVGAEFPGISIRLDFSPVPADFDGDEIDLAIRYGSGEYIGASSALIFIDTLAPVCTPKTADMLSSPEDLIGSFLLDSAESAPDGRSLWAYWASRVIGEDLAGRLCRPAQWILQSSRFTVEVLLNTPSVGILEYSVIRDEIHSGRLVAPFGNWVSAPFGYYAVTSRRRSLRPAAKRLKTLVTRNAKQHFDEVPDPAHGS